MDTVAKQYWYNQIKIIIYFYLGDCSREIVKNMVVKRKLSDGSHRMKVVNRS